MSEAKRRTRKPPMPAVLEPFAAKARKRHERRPANPGVKVVSTPDGYRLEPPHRDTEAWQAMLCDAFGTRSEGSAWTLLCQLADVCDKDRPAGGHWSTPNESELNAMLNMVNSIRPRNEIEAALVVQMVAVHSMAIRLTAQVMQSGWIDPRNAAMVGKLARTFAMQTDTLARLRGRTGKQTIKVRYERHDHKHVHLGEGGLRTNTQAQAPNGPIDGRASRELGESPALPSPDASGDALPGAGGEGQGPVSHARRS